MTAIDIPVTAGAGDGVAAASGSPRFLRRLLRNRIAVACLVYLCVIIVIAVVAPIVMPGVGAEHAGDLLAVRQGPNAHHPLGTDSLGRDVLDRLLVGTRVTMVGVAEALVVVLALGVPAGLAAGFLGGRLDRAVSWLADIIFAVPAVVIIIVVLTVFPYSMLAGMCALGVLFAPGMMRVTRAATLPVREQLYIAAARASGLSQPYIVTRHVLPRIAGPIIVYTSYLAAGALLVQAGLAFLSLLVAAPAPSWGGMVADGVGAIQLQPWLIWPPGIIIGLTILAFGLLGDAVRDATTETWLRPAPGGARRRRRGAVGVRDTTSLSSAVSEAYGPSREGILVVDGLTVEFRRRSGAVRIVEDLSFDIRAGETVGIVGESGSGKTITAMAILGLLPPGGEVSAGRVLFEGRDVVGLPEHEMRLIRGKRIGFVSQEPMISLDPSFRVGTQLAEAVRHHEHASRRIARSRALELLDLARLPNPETVARRYPHELSGGMAQRVAIARALAGDPALLIADEPTTALDVTVQAEILDLLRDLQRRRGMAVLLVTHDWGVVADTCDRAVTMYAGQIVERAPLRAMIRDPLHPYTEALLASDPHNAREDGPLPTIPGTVPEPGEWPAGCHFHPRCRYATASCRAEPVGLTRADPERETRCLHAEQVGSRL